MNIYVMKAAMKGRPYIVNEEALPVGYWQQFYAAGQSTHSWVPLKFRIERKSGKLADVLGWIGGVSLYSQKAVELLKAATKGELQFVLFGDVGDRPYWIISRVPCIPDLAPESIVKAAAVFCLPGNELREVLVKESVPETVVTKRLSGFEFRRRDKAHLKALFLGKDVNDFPGMLP